MLRNKIYLTFVLLLIGVSFISISAADEHAVLQKIDNKAFVKNQMSPKVESNLLREDSGSFISQFQNQYTKRVVFEVNGNDKSYVKSLADNGAVIETVHSNRIQASVPASQLQGISRLSFVNYVRSPMIPYKDAIVSEGVGVINSSLVNNMGLRGQGVKVAIIDLGFAGFQQKLGIKLPVSVTARSFRADGDITGGGENHGTAVAEIVSNVAPDAQLFLINFNTDVEFANAVNFAINQNVDVISMSAGFLVGPFNGTGFINEIVNNATSHGIVWVNSAGNYAQRHWEGPFNDTDGNKIHNFTPTDENMSITLTSIGDISIFLSWDDWPASNQDYDLCVSNTTGLIVCSENAQNGIQEPVEFLIGTNLPPDTYNFTIVKFNATRNVTFQLYSPLHDLKYQVPKSSLGIPADSQEAIAVGATRLNDSLEIFSSRGPTIDNRTKPDVVAPDGVSTSVILRFFGTSASAPHVAGAAALLLQAAKKKWF